MEDEEKNRLWIGNLDEKVTEYQLLKTVQKYGQIEKFDLLYYRNGPQAGKSRGYGFVTYKSEAEAERALNGLDGALFGSKHICVKWAHIVKKEDEDGSKFKPILQLPVLTGPKEKMIPQNQSLKIRAIEKKLKLMEQKSDLDSFLFEPAAKKPNVLKTRMDTKNECTNRKT